MQVELNNFRCWKKQTFTFNDKGIILINGSSGSGKSSILNAIYFAITGNGNKIVTHGEKKCSVRISFTNNDSDNFLKEITRSKSPCRLTVLYDNKLYEDEEAQKIIDNYFGNNFQHTSYMNQKMIHSFLSLTSSEKMIFLQKIILENSDTSNNSYIIKKNCKDKISELKKNHIEHKSKINLYENEIIILQKKFNEYIKNDNDTFINIEDYYKNLPNINYNPSILKELRDEQYDINDIYHKYKQYKIKEEEYNNQKHQILQDIHQYNLNKIELQNKLKCIEYKGDDYFKFLNECKSYYKLNNNYEKLVKNVESNCYNIITLINKEVDFYKTQIKLHIDKKNNIYKNLSLVYDDINYIKDNIEKWNKSTQTIIEYSNFIKDMYKKFDITEYNNIESLNTSIILSNNELEELKLKLIKKQEKLNKLKNDWTLKNKLHKCPKCHVYVRIQTDKDSKQKLVEVNNDINNDLNNDNYNKNVNQIEYEINIINNDINNKQKEIYNKETKKNELIDFNTKCDNYKKRINRADIILINYLDFNLNNNINDTSIYQNKINNINKWLDDYIKYNTEITEYETYIRNINEYSNIDICKILILDKNKLNKIIYINTLIDSIKIYTNNITNKNQSMKKLFEETLDFLLKIKNVLSDTDINFKPLVSEEEINSELILQTKNKLSYEHNNDLLNEIENKLTILNNKIIELNDKLRIIENFIKINIDIEDKFYNIEKKIIECYKLEEEYNKYTKIIPIYEQWKRINNEKRIQDYLYETVSNDIVVHEMFLNKINETESIALAHCIDNINYYINDYLEKFFPNDSILVDIVSFKETNFKKGNSYDLKPGINIKVYYKGEEVELSSLSGGEYDRVSLAIMLSFNHICKSNIILLDESIASLDAELTNEILEKLKDTLNNKRIIVVAHQLSTGIFDQIINTK